MSLFHAFYFVSQHVATTIGSGEILYAFTDAQRLWSACRCMRRRDPWDLCLWQPSFCCRTPTFQEAEMQMEPTGSRLIRRGLDPRMVIDIDEECNHHSDP